MNLAELLKLIKGLISKGFATAEEKKKVADAVKALSKDEQEAVEDKADEVNKLPEEGEEGAGEGAGEEDEVAKGIETLVKNATEAAVTKMKAELENYLAEQKDLIEKKAGVYSPEVQPKRKELNKRVKEVLMAVKNNDVAAMETFHKKEMTTDDTATPFAGYVTDTELSAEIRHLITEYGVARREMLTIQLSKHALNANSLETDLSVYWVDEGVAIQSSEVVLGQTKLELKKLAVIVALTNELLEDQEIDLVSFIAGRVAENFAKKEDEAFFKGDGTSTYGGFTGLLNNTNVNEVVMTGATFASIDADDLIDMVDATPQGAMANGKYYMHRTIMSYIRKLKDTTGEYIYQRPSESGPATVWGYPVVLVEAMPTKLDTAADTSFVLFGDLKKASILGYKGAIKIDRFDAGVVRNVANDGDINLITTDRQAVRFKERVGAITIIPTAVTKLTTASASV